MNESEGYIVGYSKVVNKEPGSKLGYGTIEVWVSLPRLTLNATKACSGVRSY